MILLKIDGVDGNAKVANHDKWIQCAKLEWDAGRPISKETGKTSDRVGTIMQCNDITIVKDIDSSSAELFELACGGAGKKVEIHFVSGTGDDAKSYSEWMLENALISSYSVTGGVDGGTASGKPDAQEIIKINFVTIEIKSIPRGPDAAGPYPVKFSRETGKKG
jgi:type VI secretion system secreted protein Hcp